MTAFTVFQTDTRHTPVFRPFSEHPAQGVGSTSSRKGASVPWGGTAPCWLQGQEAKKHLLLELECNGLWLLYKMLTWEVSLLNLTGQITLLYFKYKVKWNSVKYFFPSKFNPIIIWKKKIKLISTNIFREVASRTYDYTINTKLSLQPLKLVYNTISPKL